MAMTLRKRVSRTQELSDSSPERKRPKRGGRGRPRVQRRRRERWISSESDVDSEDDQAEEEGTPEYEKVREQRMKENREKMAKLGIFGLAQQLKPQVPSRSVRAQKKSNVTRSFAAPYQRARQSARLKEVRRGNFFKDEGTLESMGISVPDGWAPEVYTEEHEKLLGGCEKPWTLYVDGYGEDGERLYDPLNGKMCHQCRQKTVGNFSICRKCKSTQGQLCGDCLYMRYGENVLEVNENINWSCPSCRDICNCSRCRRAKGWAPTVCVYQKVVEQGYKSIAHYLIQSCGANNKPKDNVVAADANVNPELAAQSAPHMKYVDTSDGSSDDDLGYNSDSSEEAEEPQHPSVEVLDDEEEMKVAEEPQQPSVKVLDDEEELELITLEASDNDNEVLGAEMKDAEVEQSFKTESVCL